METARLANAGCLKSLTNILMHFEDFALWEVRRFA